MAHIHTYSCKPRFLLWPFSVWKCAASFVCTIKTEVDGRGWSENDEKKKVRQRERESSHGHLFYALKACFNLWIGFELYWKYPGSDWTINNPHRSRYKCWRSSVPEILSISFSSAVNPRRWLMRWVSCCHSCTTLAECKHEDNHAWMNACTLQMWICECLARTYSILLHRLVASQHHDVLKHHAPSLGEPISYCSVTTTQHS